MTPEQLDEIEARLHYLSLAPWEHVHVFDGEEVIRAIAPDGRGDRIVAYAQYEVEGRFIAAARTDVPALVAEVRRLRALLADVFPAAD
jgi:hypothetical protein